MMSDCKKILPLAALMAVSLPVEQGLASGVSEITVSQTDEIPLLTRQSGDVAFTLAVSAACEAPAQSLALIANIADTLVSADVDTASDATSLAIVVPSAQLSGMQRQLLCKRLNSRDEVEATPLIRGAFSVQVTGICSGAELPETQRTVNAALDVRIDCEVSDDRSTRPGS